jgi:hypothetical protein
VIRQLCILILGVLLGLLWLVESYAWAILAPHVHMPLWLDRLLACAHLSLTFTLPLVAGALILANLAVYWHVRVLEQEKAAV